MPVPARLEPHKDQRHDAAHEASGARSEPAAEPSPSQLEVNGKAGRAAVERMSRGSDHAVGGTTAGTAAHAPSAGDSGMLTADLTVKLDGADVRVPKGTYVVVKEVKGHDLVCKVFSSFGGKEAVLPAASFWPEPALAHSSEAGHTSEPHDWTYQEYTSTLWSGAPKAGDVAQGYLGDCYLNAAMGAVAAANPQAIKNLFSPQAPNQKQYTITLSLRDGKGGFLKHPVTVDTNLPTRAQDARNASPIYTLMGHGMSKHDVPLWPALLEKAYAQMMGGYDIIGDKGGYSDRAMEALTGVASRAEVVATKDADVLAEFKGFQAAGKAVVCGTLDSRAAQSQGGFTGAGKGPYRNTLKTDQGESAEIVPGTLSIKDKAGKVPSVTDNGDGGFTGGAAGKVGYDAGLVDLTYAADGPAKAADLSADYSWRGLLDKGLNVHAWHAYIFESVTADNKLQFKNPWGVEHPLPLAPADFKRLFTGINSNQVPKAPPANPGKKTVQ